jgi:hypothetical protein
MVVVSVYTLILEGTVPGYNADLEQFKYKQNLPTM